MMIAAKRQRPILKHIPPLGVWVPPLVVGDPPLGGRGATPKIGFRQISDLRYSTSDSIRDLMPVMIRCDLRWFSDFQKNKT